MKINLNLPTIALSFFFCIQILVLSCLPAARFVLTMRPYLVNMGNVLANSALAVTVEQIIDEIWVALEGKKDNTATQVDPYADIVSANTGNPLLGRSKYDLNIEFSASFDQNSSIKAVEVARKDLNFERISKESPWMQTFNTKKTIHERTRVGSAQVCLDVLGYNTGEIDGKHGNITSRALKQFQKNVGLPVNGNLDDTTYDYLMSMVDVLKKNRF